MLYSGKDSTLNPAKILFRPQNPDYLIKNVPWMSAPAIARSRGGRLYMTFNTGPDDPISNMLTLSKSDDDGQSWEECIYAVIAPNGVRIHEPLVWADPKGDIYLSWVQSYETWDGRGGVWVAGLSEEDSDHPILEEPHRVCNGVMANDPTFETDGSWLLPVGRWSWESPYYHDPFHCYSMLYRSIDRGLTADCIGRAVIPKKTFDELSFARLSDRRLMMIVRTEYGWGKSVSSDEGFTWSKAEVFRCGPSAKSLIRNLPDGRLLWVGYDTDRPVRERIAAMISEDDGKTWPFKLLLDPRENVSYPNSHITSEGVIYITHDYDRHGDKQAVLHRITVQDIEAGKLVSKNSFTGRIALAARR